jgi:hypothetical protein
MGDAVAGRLHPSLRQLLGLVALISAGWAVGVLVGVLAGIEGVTDSDAYMLATMGLLAIGLYGGTSTISISDARHDLQTILEVVTVGVLLKAALVGSVLAAVFGDRLFFLLAVAVAQIDPLSVAALMKDSHLSERARAVLASWSAFDDPVTVVLALSLVTAMGRSLAGDDRTVEAFAGLEGLAGFGESVSLNLALVVFAGVLWLVLWRFASRFRATAGAASVLVVGSLAVWRSLLLGLAAAGLFMRPPSKSWTLWVERAVTAAFYAAAVMLGILLAEGIHLVDGVALGVMAYGAQVVVGFILTRRLPHTDRVHLALSQQNGITSIILALTLEPVVPGVVAVIGPAVVTINVLHYVMGRLVSHRPELFGIRRPVVPPAPVPAQAGPASQENKEDQQNEENKENLENQDDMAERRDDSTRFTPGTDTPGTQAFTGASARELWGNA